MAPTHQDVPVTDIRLINTTTRLPVDSAIEEGFVSLLHDPFAAAVLEASTTHHVDVNMVMRDDPDLMADDLGDDVLDPDWLGVYMPHGETTHRPVIKVSPERVMEICPRMYAKSGIALPLVQLYPALLNAVIIHELAHALMDAHLLYRNRCHPRTWREHVDWLEDNRRLVESSGLHGKPLLPATSADTFENDPVLEAEMLAHLRNRYAAQDHACKNSSGPLPGNLRQLCKIAEESLANGLVLKQYWSPAQHDAVHSFIEHQKYEYRLGLKWTGTIDQLIDAGLSWAKYKKKRIGIMGKSWPKAERHQQKRLEDVVERLSKAGEEIDSWDYLAEPAQ